MKKLVFLFLLLSIGYIMPQAAGPFEGKIIYTEYNGDLVEIGTVDYWIKKDDTRLDFSSGGSMLVTNGMVYYMMHDSKTYSSVPHILDIESEEYKEMKLEISRNVQKFDQKRTLIGFPCERWLIRKNDEQTEIWVTKGFKRFVMFDDLTSKESIFWHAVLQDQYFPLEVTEYDSHGNIKGRFSATGHERIPLDEEFFRVPGKYKPVSK